MVNKRENNLQQLLMRNDPCNVKDDQQLREDCGNSSYKNFDSCKNFADETTYGV